MKNKLFVILGVLITLILSSSAIAIANESKEASQKKTVEGYVVELVTPDHFTVGEKDIKVIITKDGQPVKALPVKLKAEMDKSDESMDMDMDKEKPIEKELTEGENGEYLTKVNFEDDGKWIFSIMVGNMPEASFEVAIEAEGTNWTTLGGFMGILAIIFIFASIFKKKSPPKEDLPTAN